MYTYFFVSVFTNTNIYVSSSLRIFVSRSLKNHLIQVSKYLSKYVFITVSVSISICTHVSESVVVHAKRTEGSKKKVWTVRQFTDGKCCDVPEPVCWDVG